MLVGVAGIIGLTANGDIVPESLTAVTTTALGALAALLVSTRTGPDPTRPSSTVGGGSVRFLDGPLVDPPTEPYSPK